MKKIGKIMIMLLTMVVTMSYFNGVVLAEEKLADGKYFSTTAANAYKIAYKLTVMFESNKVKNATFAPYLVDGANKTELTYEMLSYVDAKQKVAFKKMLDDAKLYSNQLVATSDATKIEKIPESDDAYNALQTAWNDIVFQAQ